MVDATEIPLANQLLNELATIDGAIQNIDAGGLITSFVIGVPPSPPPDSQLVPHQVDARYMTAPPAMYDAIKVLLTQRRTDIVNQLAALGVTTGTTLQAAAQPAAHRAPSHPTSKR